MVKCIWGDLSEMLAADGIASERSGSSLTARYKLWTSRNVCFEKVSEIRYGGFLASPIREENLTRARQALGVAYGDELMPQIDSELSPEQEGERLQEQKCPKCHMGTMRAIDVPVQAFRYDAVMYEDSS